VVTEQRHPVALLYLAVSAALLWVVYDNVDWWLLGHRLGVGYGWREGVSVALACAVAWRCVGSALGRTPIATAALPAAVGLALLANRVREWLALQQLLTHQEAGLFFRYADPRPAWWRDVLVLIGAAAVGVLVGWWTERRWT
jgi:hypothetical protein